METTKKSEKNIKLIYKIIKDFINQNGYSPSARDIMKISGFKSVSSVHGYIVKLEKLGLITRSNNVSRSINLIEKNSSKDTVGVPIIGTVAAGRPIIAEQNIIDQVQLPKNIANKDTYILNVAGNSMIDAGIYEGDKLIVRYQKDINNGEIAVVLIDNEATVKRFYKEKDHIRLHPENNNMQDIIVEDCSVCGKVIGLYRSI